MADYGRGSRASGRGVVHALLRWAGITLAGMVGLIVLVIAVAAVLDRPSTEPLAIDRTTPRSSPSSTPSGHG